MAVSVGETLDEDMTRAEEMVSARDSRPKMSERSSISLRPDVDMAPASFSYTGISHRFVVRMVSKGSLPSRQRSVILPS